MREITAWCDPCYIKGKRVVATRSLVTALNELGAKRPAPPWVNDFCNDCVDTYIEWTSGLRSVGRPVDNGPGQPVSDVIAQPAKRDRKVKPAESAADQPSLMEDDSVQVTRKGYNRFDRLTCPVCSHELLARYLYPHGQRRHGLPAYKFPVRCPDCDYRPPTGIGGKQQRMAVSAHRSNEHNWRIPDYALELLRDKAMSQ